MANVCAEAIDWVRCVTKGGTEPPTGFSHSSRVVGVEDASFVLYLDGHLQTTDSPRATKERDDIPVAICRSADGLVLVCVREESAPGLLMQA